MSLLTVAEARAAGLGRGLSDADLQARINGTEGQLARRIGPLTGLRTTVVNAGRAVWLPRPWKADPAPIIRDAGVVVDTAKYAIWPNGRVLLTDGLAWAGPRVEVDWTPDDEAAVREAVISLLDLQLRPYQSESIGDYSYARGGQKMLQRTRDEIYASLVYGAGTGL